MLVDMLKIEAMKKLANYDQPKLQTTNNQLSNLGVFGTDYR